MSCSRSIFDGGFYYDDGYHLEQAEFISRGEISLTDYATRPHGEHLIPVWKVMFYGCWSAFGESSVAFHMFVAVLHTVSAFLLLGLIREYASERSAIIAAVLWAGAAIGGWDGPFLWIAASHLSVGVTFFLAAMLCVTRYRHDRSSLWAILMSVCLLTSLLTMGSLIVLTPVLVLQYLLFERQSAGAIQRDIRWLVGWAVPCVIVGILHLVWVVPAMEDLNRPPVDVWAGLQMLGGGYAASSWNLLFWAGSAVTWGRLAGAILIAALMLGTDRRAQKLCLLFFSLSFCFSVLAYMARSGWVVEHVLMWGRYRYLPTLFWCVVLCLVIDQAWRNVVDQWQQAARLGACCVLMFLRRCTAPNCVRCGDGLSADLRGSPSGRGTGRKNAGFCDRH